MTNPSLFDQPDPEPPLCPHSCPYCGADVLDAFTDTGTLMRVVPVTDGPYALDGDTLRYLSNDNWTMFHGKADVKMRRVDKNEAKWASHFYDCTKRAEWRAPKQPERE